MGRIFERRHREIPARVFEATKHPTRNTTFLQLRVSVTISSTTNSIFCLLDVNKYVVDELCPLIYKKRVRMQLPLDLVNH